jgi:glutaredoxin
MSAETRIERLQADSGRGEAGWRGGGEAGWRGDGEAGRRAGRIGVVTLYSRPGCHLCEDARRLLKRLQLELGFDLVEYDIDADEALHRDYFDRIPVIALDGRELCEHLAEEQLLRDALVAWRS